MYRPPRSHVQPPPLLSRVQRPELDRLRRWLPARPLTHFAPSPTGWLHLGHAMNAGFVWGIARALGGRVLLRLEDQDRGRCRSECERGLIEDLEWLGLKPDFGTTAGLRAGPSSDRQSDCEGVYSAALVLKPGGDKLGKGERRHRPA